MNVLYKYVTHQRAEACIPEMGDGALRATQPAALNDPFECAVVPMYVISDEKDENRQLAQTLTLINGSKRVTPDDVDRARREYGSLFTRQLFAEQVSTRFGIVSFSADPFHQLLWSHYAKDGSGFAIGYDAHELQEISRADDALRAVDYRARPPQIIDPIVLANPESNLPIILSQKSDRWSYENEWRLIVELDTTVGTGLRDPHGLPINLVRIPNKAVVSVHYTERTPRESVELIRRRLADENNRYRAG
ncbi:MAG: DUF2971 domain-containing protein [Rhodothermaceae bacterium]|nr:DUF2971 domain-containing protein [Rhodothermaceae bacterium]